MTDNPAQNFSISRSWKPGDEREVPEAFLNVCYFSKSLVKRFHGY